MAEDDIICRTKKPRIISLPEDLVFDVLSRLPAKSVARFKCVSKSWYDLIENNKCFSDISLYHASTNSSMVIMHHRISETKSGFYTIDYDTKKIKEINYPPQLEYDIHDLIHEIEVVSSTHGALCLRYILKNKRKFAIWNPLSQTYLDIACPFLDDCCPSADYNSPMGFGFGYEKTTDDYKVVLLTYCEDFDYSNVLPGHYHGWIYSLKLNTWKILEKNSYALYNDQCTGENNGVFCSGGLHWFAEPEGDTLNMILRFGLVDEKFDLVRHPFNCDDRSLSVLGDCLCLTECKNQDGFQIWLMNKNDSLNWSWSKMINLVDHNLQSFVKQSFYIKVVAYNPVKRKLVFKHGTRLQEVLFCYDLVHSSIEILHAAIFDDDPFFAAFPYTQTLRML